MALVRVDGRKDWRGMDSCGDDDKSSGAAKTLSCTDVDDEST